MTASLQNPFLSLQPLLGSKPAAASASSPGRAAAVTNPAPEVVALTAPGMARCSRSGVGPDAGNDSQCNRCVVTAGRDRQPIFSDSSTATRTFGPGDVLARFETDLASIVTDINAHERFMRRLPVFIAKPNDAFLTAVSFNP